MCNQKQSNFHLTCNLLNQYLKEKKRLSEVSGLINMNSISERKSSGLVPQKTPLTLFPELDLNMADRAVLPENAATGEQMTILYNGDVLTFDNVPSENAASLINFARKCTSAMSMEMLPMTRRSSLQRFLQTRKNRIKSKAPYKTKGHGSKLENFTANDALGDKTWLGLSINN